MWKTESTENNTLLTLVSQFVINLMPSMALFYIPDKQDSGMISTSISIQVFHEYVVNVIEH